MTSLLCMHMFMVNGRASEDSARGRGARLTSLFSATDGAGGSWTIQRLSWMKAVVNPAEKGGIVEAYLTLG